MSAEFEVLLCTSSLLKLFDCEDEDEFAHNFFARSHEVQPCGMSVKEKLEHMSKLAFSQVVHEDKWAYIDSDGEDKTLNVRVIKVDLGEGTRNSCFALVFYKAERLLTSLDSEGDITAIFRAIIDATPLALNVWDSNMNNAVCNKQVLSLFGIADENEFLENFSQFSPVIQPNGISSKDMFLRNMEIVKREGQHRFKWLHLDKNGNEIPSEITLTKANILDDEENIVGFIRDLRPEFEQSNEDEIGDFYFQNKIPEKAILSKVAEISDDIFFAIDKRTANIRFIGSGFQKVTNEHQVSDITAPIFSEDSVHEDDGPIYLELAKNIQTGVIKPVELRFLQPDGTYRYFKIIYRFIYDHDNNPIIVIGKGVDIDEQRLLREQAKLDSLTGCYSKTNAESMIENRLARPKDARCAILYINIKDFKTFNEQHGHYYGDELLRKMVAKIKTWCESKDIVGRIGGDEFVVYVEDITDLSIFEKNLTELIKRLNETYSVYDMDGNVCVNAGVAICEGEAKTYTALLSRAAKALHMAKTSETCRWFYYEDTIEEFVKAVSTKSAKTQKISGLSMDHTISSAIFNILYERNSDHVAINSALKYLGQTYNVSRCFIVESFDQGETFGFTHEWRKDDVQSHIENNTTFSVSMISDLIENARENGLYSCDDINYCNLKDSILANIVKSGTKAFLHSQVRREDSVMFFIGVEDCDKTRKWTDVEINTLNYMTRVFSVILQSKHLDRELKVLSEHSILSAFVGDNTDNFIYIVDPDNFDMIHMNKKALGMYGNPDESVWRSKKCYELLHNKTEPCEFCTNDVVTEDSFYEWNYYNPTLKKTYLFKDKLVRLSGKLAKLQVATDITALVTLEAEIKNKLEEQSLLLECIKMLHTSDAPVVSIEKILNIVGKFFDASRGVILQISADGLKVCNTHEWTDKLTKPSKDSLQNIEMSELHSFYEKLNKVGVFYCDDISEFDNKDDSVSSILRRQGTQSLISAPILDTSGKVVGALAVENPKNNSDKYWLLESIAGFVADFLEKNNLIDSLNSLSYYDTLTNVKNRHSYNKALREMDGETISSLGVAYVDITGLAKINEEKGLRYGDDLIKKLANILSGIFDDNIFRVGGDEFVVLEKNVEENIFEGKIDTLKNMIFEEPDLKASVGYTWNSNVGGIEEGDLEQFDSARDSRNYTAILSKNLDNEIKSGKYVVFLQPQINLQNNELDGAEALIRRVDARGSMQSPISFVPFYEKEGMISKIDLHVFETVCKLVSDWKKRNIGMNLKFSVNCSRNTIMEDKIVNKLSAICDNHEVSKSMFIIEITETISHYDNNKFAYVISALKSAGFCVSLDDFGTGYSNLSSLQNSEFDEIKIDMGLTRTVHLDPKSRILTKVALNLSTEFGNMVTVAEGLETLEQVEVLRELNCEKGQGYYFSKPISIGEFEEKYFGGK